MKKLRKKRNIHIDIMRNREEDEYESLQKKSYKIKDDIDSSILAYIKMIKILGTIVFILIVLIIVLLFIKTSNKRQPIKKHNLIMTNETINNSISSNLTDKDNPQIENKDNEENKKDNNTIPEMNHLKENHEMAIENNNQNNQNQNIQDQNNLIPVSSNNNPTGGKRKIYVKYMDFWPAFILKNFDVHKILLEKYEVIESDTPDYVIFSEFGGENYGIENRIDCVKLFLSIENRDPNFAITDYAIGIHYINEGDRYFRKPTETHQLTALGNVYNATKLRGVGTSNRKFCAWVVSNGSGTVRNNFYDELSKYKTVDSGGSFRNNVGGSVDDKLGFLKNYKFSICFENSKTAGYISEKLSDAFEAGTIPIYYGDDTVLELLNNRSYIHVIDENDFKDKIELIKKIDQNDTLYEEMIREKIVIDDSRYPREVQKYKNFVYHIIEQDKEKAKRFERKKNLVKNNLN
jgi:hypothetical protein